MLYVQYDNDLCDMIMVIATMTITNINVKLKYQFGHWAGSNLTYFRLIIVLMYLGHMY